MPFLQRRLTLKDRLDTVDLHTAAALGMLRRSERIRDTMLEGGILDIISALSPSEFENLTYDCVRASGLRNLVWRTPGADGGRDIEGTASYRDVSGHECIQTWYVECKRYSTSLSWPLVYEKIAHADVQGADVLLVVTNSNPSPPCENEIARWNSAKRRPIIRFWRGYDLPALIRSHPAIAAAYGLSDSITQLHASLLPLSFLISKIVQGAHVATEFEVVPRSGLEAGACLSELLSQRLDDLDRFGRIVPSGQLNSAPAFEWLDWEGTVSGWEEVGARAMLAFLKIATGSSSVKVSACGAEATVTLTGAKFELTAQALADLETVAHWARMEVGFRSLHTAIVLRRT